MPSAEPSRVNASIISSAGISPTLAQVRVKAVHLRKRACDRPCGMGFSMPVLAQQIVRFDMRDIGGELILRRAVHGWLAANKNHREPDLRQCGDNLVHP